MTLLAVISDIHGNAMALEVALAQIAARGVARAVVLGDLLTYGCEPLRVLELLNESPLHLAFVRGNHDVLYGTDGDDYEQALPEWIRESVQWTRAAIGQRPLPDSVESLTEGGFFFAHANPFRFGDWTYMSSPAEIQRAADALSDRGFRGGVFGHTHRARVTAAGPGGPRDLHGASLEIRLDEPLIINAGSVGQPRGTGATILYFEATDREVRLEFEPVRYDVAAHLALIHGSTLSAATRKRLAGFFDA